jgi:hypothetical protein
MRRYLLGKALALGVVVLFIGIGLQPAFAVDTNISSSDDEKPVYTDGEILENYDCYIRGITDFTVTIKYSKRFIYFFEGNFGISGSLYGDKITAYGWIYTDGSNGKWNYRGFLKGADGVTTVQWLYGDVLDVYIAVKGFKGLLFGAWDYWLPIGVFIGYAESIKIETIQ